MDNWLQYAPYILMVIVFCVSYNIFVTPKELDKKLEKYVLKETYIVTTSEMKSITPEELGKILEKYVLKETYLVTTSEMKSDVSDIKIKVDKIYDKLIQG